MIEVNNLIKKFGDFRALDGVNMHVASGNIYGLVGPNGAGKSTLIRHLTGVYRQDAGEIFIDGAPVYENKQVKAQMAYIPVSNSCSSSLRINSAICFSDAAIRSPSRSQTYPSSSSS